jgi:hypothetical protein
MKPAALLLAAALVATGLAFAGHEIARGLVQARTGDRYVTVKGLSEREVEADLALWRIRFVATSNDLAEAQARITADARKVTEFLAGAGLAPEEIELQSLEVTDLLAQPYRSGPLESRFIVAQTLRVRSGAVDRITSASQHIGALVESGVVLSSEGPSQGPLYLFTRLNDVKPEMIAEATRRAREAAQEFAADSGSRIAGIRRASQGLFEILPRDKAPGLEEARQREKTVRVVSTIEFVLSEQP